MIINIYLLFNFYIKYYWKKDLKLLDFSIKIELHDLSNKILVLNTYFKFFRYQI